MKRIYIETYGCQMNVLDSEMIKSMLHKHGYEITNNIKEADIIMANTCSVRQHAEERVYSRFGAYKSLRKKKPHIKFGIIGCMAQKDKEKIFERLPHINFVVGTQSYSKIIEVIEKTNNNGYVIEIEEKPELLTYEREESFLENKYSSYVLVMKGCDSECSFCVVPQTRGKAVSRTIPDIIEEIKSLIDKGVKQIILTGQNITQYGWDIKDKRARLHNLLYEVVKIKGILRIKFITSHPAFLSKEVLEVMKDFPVISPYLHIPAQSGSNRILKLMKRGYTKEKYLEIISMARSYIENIGIASDFIVGFPSENQQDFDETVDLVQKVCFTQSYVFKYSPRPGTQSYNFPQQISREIIESRHKILNDMQMKISYRQNLKLIGSIQEVFVEGKTRKGKLEGRAPDNRIVHFEGQENLIGKLIKIQINSATPLALYGTPLDK
ncbi:MAG: tRNA (N6-isopentenyl adenosine(37)-C2)-methylthiotransferase MiaB [Planctomycetota bacterium]